jgi:anti-sigma factor RsiW
MAGCQDIQTQLIVQYDGDLPSDETRRIAEHLLACSECARDARLIREALERTRALPVAQPSEAFWESFGATLRRRIGEAPPPRPSLWTRMAGWIGDRAGMRPVPALAASTALGLLLAIGLIRGDRGTPALPSMEVLAIGEQLGIAQDLEILKNLDLLEEVEVLERLPLLRQLNGGRRSPLG